jgi:hypothetical protein
MSRGEAWGTDYDVRLARGRGISMILQRHQLVLFAQLLATALLLGFAPGNFTKLLAMLLIWLVGFWPLSRPELLLMLGADILFTAMNLGALHKGVFVFDHADLLGMPVYEFFMWGFYTLHVIRTIDGRPPGERYAVALVMAALFAVPFSTIARPDLLLLASGAVLVTGIVVFHEPLDLAYVGYMLFVGAVIEGVGVWTGQWHYPGTPIGGVPIWSVTMWSGIGLFTRRLLLPLVRRSPAGR